MTGKLASVQWAVGFWSAWKCVNVNIPGLFAVATYRTGDDSFLVNGQPTSTPHEHEMINEFIYHLIRMQRRRCNSKAFFSFAHGRIINCLYIVSIASQQLVANPIAQPRIANGNGNNMTFTLHLRNACFSKSHFEIIHLLLVRMAQPLSFLAPKNLQIMYRKLNCSLQ